MILKSKNRYNITLEEGEEENQTVDTTDDPLKEENVSEDNNEENQQDTNIQPDQNNDKNDTADNTDVKQDNNQEEEKVDNNQPTSQSSQPKEVSYDKIVNSNSPTVVISAFPTLGKSTFVNNHDDCLDLESSIYSKKVDGSRNEEFPKNYVDMLKYHLINNNWRYIFVASHKETREALKQEGIKFYTLYPTLEKKQEVLDCCKVRGNTPEFIKLIEENYDNWVADMSKEPLSYALAPGEFISDELFDTKLKFLKR